jgi:hypothetical protein
MLPNCSHSKKFLLNAAYSKNLLFRLVASFYSLKCAGCRATYNQARRTSILLRLELFRECPPSVLRTVYSRTRPRRTGVISRIVETIFLHPRIAFGSSAVAAAVIVVMAYYLITTTMDVTQSPVYTSSDIELARRQVEETFTLLVPLIHNAELNLKEDIIMRQVIPPLRDGISTTTELISKGIRQ